MSPGTVSRQGMRVDYGNYYRPKDKVELSEALAEVGRVKPPFLVLAGLHGPAEPNALLLGENIDDSGVIPEHFDASEVMFIKHPAENTPLGFAHKKHGEFMELLDGMEDECVEVDGTTADEARREARNIHSYIETGEAEGCGNPSIFWFNLERRSSQVYDFIKSWGRDQMDLDLTYLDEIDIAKNLAITSPDTIVVALHNQPKEKGELNIGRDTVDRLRGVLKPGRESEFHNIGEHEFSDIGPICIDGWLAEVPLIVVEFPTPRDYTYSPRVTKLSRAMEPVIDNDFRITEYVEKSQHTLPPEEKCRQARQLQRLLTSLVKGAQTPSPLEVDD